jgi:DNA mismatch repair protein MutS2
MHQKALLWLLRPTASGVQVGIFRLIPKRGSGWHPITGKIEDGEDVREGMIREFTEETGGIETADSRSFIDLGLSQNFMGRFGEAEEHAFALEISDASWRPVLDPKEHTRFEWVPPSDALERLEHEFHREALFAALKYSEQKLQSLLDLEWDRFLNFASLEASSIPAQDQISSLIHPATWAATAERADFLQEQVMELTPVVDKAALWGPLSGLDLVGPQLEILRKGGVLEARSLHRLRQWLAGIESWCQFPRDSLGRLFKNDLARLFDPYEILRSLDRLLTSEGNISETASPEMQRVCSEIRSIEAKMADRIDSLMRDYSAKGWLQERIIDKREGHWVVPVKTSELKHIEGRAVEHSVSKQTIYVQPKELESLELELRSLSARRAEEEFRLLQEASLRIAPFADEIEVSIEILIEWDTVHARAKVAQRVEGKRVHVVKTREFFLDDTAHPLLYLSLDSNQIVRNTLEIRPPHALLLISGPNTGGKTVFLKTVAFAAICARTGFFLPGRGTHTIPFFRNVMTDVGDPQSMEQHLSSFSGHILKMKSVLESSSDEDLILLDELNSATDPEEGAALSQAILDTLLSRMAPSGTSFIVATTHDPRLKINALKDERVLNASILFDEETLSPTYSLVYGTPGRSRAIDTARRLGLPKDVIARAIDYLGSEKVRFEETIAGLQTELKGAETKRREADTALAAAKALESEWERKIKEEVTAAVEKTRQKLKQVLELAQLEMRDTLRSLQGVRTVKDVEAVRAKLSDTVVQTDARLQSEVPDSDVVQPAVHFEVGMWVRVPKWKNVGEITEWDGSKARVVLGAQKKAGSMGQAFVVTVFPVEMERLSDVELKQIDRTKDAGKKKAVTVAVDAPMTAPELDLRGKRFEEAMMEFDAFLDRAFRSGRAEVTIIHGIGTGALRTGIRDRLNGVSYVTAIEDAGRGSSDGATRVRFR